MRFEVDTNQLSSVSTQFTQTLDQLSQIREQMFSAMQNLSTVWQGEAHDAFLRQVEEDNQYVMQVIEDIRQGARQMSEARAAYDNCEADALQQIQTIPL